jgi:hypothetical protein
MMIVKEPGIAPPPRPPAGGVVSRTVLVRLEAVHLLEPGVG